MDRSAGAGRDDLPTGALAAFVVMTFAITWGAIGPYVVAPEWAASRFGEISGSHPVFVLATWGPAISAFVLVAIHGGMRGLGSFLSRLLLWRVGPVWVALVLLVLPLVFVAGSLIKGGGVLAALPPGGVSAGMGALVMMLILGPIEEFGWRGVAQPLLQRLMAPFWAGAIVGVVWGLWHLPAFYLAGMVFTEWHFMPFFLGNVTLAILVTPLFNAAKGSLLWAMLFHWQLINPFWPDAQPWDTWILICVTALVVWLKRDAMFSRTGQVQRVLPER